MTFCILPGAGEGNAIIIPCNSSPDAAMAQSSAAKRGTPECGSWACPSWGSIPEPCGAHLCPMLRRVQLELWHSSPGHSTAHAQQLCGTELQFVSLLQGCPVHLDLPQHKASSWQRV